jgi:Tol biopolymer transport system component
MCRHSSFVRAALFLFVLALTSHTSLADDADWAIYVMRLDGSQLRRVCRVDGYQAHGSPRWSHDGKRLAFDASGGPNGARNFFVVNLAGDGLRKVGQHATPDWSPDDKQLLFMRYEGSGSSVWVQNLDGEGATRLADAACARWSADGSRLLYMDQPEQRLLALDLSSGDSQVLLDGGYARIEPGFDWSPDGKRVALVGVDSTNNNRELVILEADGTQRVRNNRGRLEGAVSWSPEGRRLALAVNFQIALLDVDATSPPRVVPGQAGRATDPAWSPDGQWIAFASDRADK